MAKVNWEDENIRHCYRHTASHIMAQAIQHLWPEAKFAIGPAIDNGFYYDIDVDHKFTEEDFPKIQKEMKRIIKQNLPLERTEVSREEALKFFAERNQDYKVELINDLPEDAVISMYTQGDFTDLCAGPHMDNTGQIKAVKLMSVAGAYWRGDSNRQMLQRIYATAFPSQEELDAYVNMLEEAKKRDHRKIGKEMKLFMFRDEAPGFPFYLPNGMILRNALTDYWRGVHKKWEYTEVMTPQIMKRTLWETSGHWDHYKENMYTTVIDDEDYAIKPMNCPGSILVYENEPHSYRDLPLRYSELGNVHRHELSGALHGMFRVRNFTQDDAHILLADDQIEEEMVRIIKLYDEIYSCFGLTYNIFLSTMPEDHIGTREDWEAAEGVLEKAIRSIGKDFGVNEGDGAFYGPKLDFIINDSLGREWQCGTVQLDYQLPGRFGIEYTGSDGQKHTPVMIHRACFGSLERFIGVITEHFAGKFPLWMAPLQVKLITVTDKQAEYAESVRKELEEAGLRVELDNRNESLGYRLRAARNARDSYICVIGEKEAETNSVTVRASKIKDEVGNMPLEVFKNKLLEEIDRKLIGSIFEEN
ncbi:MAG: threonine--tRNA ligase [Lachnospiraceae bacterium]|nr:threonine--tRNA ligase [Lachnospiraceae bacterium]MBQ5440856.1 threonine--tRNA ligase [Bacillota bacterium]